MNNSAPIVFDARVQLTLTVEVHLDVRWNGEATIAGITKEAQERAIGAVGDAISIPTLKGRVLGKPTVHIVSSQVLG